MKKIIIAALALIMLASTTDVMAQPKAVLGVGGGLITNGSQPGGGINLRINREDNPLAIGVTGEYFSKSGTSTVPVGVMGVYQAGNEDGNMAVFFGVGSGVIRVKTSVTILGATISASTTKALVTGVGGVQFNFTPKVGFFAKGQFYRAAASGATNFFSVGGGLAFNLGGE